MKRSFRLALVASLVPLTLGLCAFGWHHRMQTPEQRVERAEEWIKGKLDLDDAQTGKLDALGKEALGLANDWHASRDQDFDELIKEVRGTLDRQSLDQAVTKRRALLDQHLPQILDRLVEFHASLNNDQKAQVADFLQKMREHHGK